jgi:hypothetical protein
MPAVPAEAAGSWLSPLEAWAVATLCRVVGGGNFGPQAGAGPPPAPPPYQARGNGGLGRQHPPSPAEQQEQAGASCAGGQGGALLCDGRWRRAAAASQQRLVRGALQAGGAPGPGASGRVPAAAAAAGEERERAAQAAVAGASREDDPLGLCHPITRVLALLPPRGVAHVMLALSAAAPRTAEALLARALPPAGAQLLTDRLEAAEAELDRVGVVGSSNGRDWDIRGASSGGGAEGRDGGGGAPASMREVYMAMYGPGVGADPQAVLDRLLRGKLALAAAVEGAVLPRPAAPLRDASG